MKAAGLILFCIFYLSCKQSKNSEYQSVSKQGINFTFENASWNPKVLSVIDSFVEENNCEKCIYELYINKVLPNYLLVNIKTRPPSAEYLKNQQPLFTSIIKGRLFYIYTGLEDILVGDKRRIYITTDTSVLFYKNWTIVITGDSLKIKKDGGIPFFPSIDENPYYNKVKVTDSASFK
jgi:hypothetical protein